MDLLNPTPEIRRTWPKPIIKTWVMIEHNVWIPLYLMVDTAANSTLDLANIRKSAADNYWYYRVLDWINENSLDIKSTPIDTRTPYKVQKMIALRTRLKGHDQDNEIDKADELKISFNVREEVSPGCPVHGFLGIDTVGKYGINISAKQQYLTAITTKPSHFNITITPYRGREYTIGSVQPHPKEILRPMGVCQNENLKHSFCSRAGSSQNQQGISTRQAASRRPRTLHFRPQKSNKNHNPITEQRKPPPTNTAETTFETPPPPPGSLEPCNYPNNRTTKTTNNLHHATNSHGPTPPNYYHSATMGATKTHNITTHSDPTQRPQYIRRTMGLPTTHHPTPPSRTTPR